MNNKLAKLMILPALLLMHILCFADESNPSANAQLKENAKQFKSEQRKQRKEFISSQNKEWKDFRKSIADLPKNERIKKMKEKRREMTGSKKTFNSNLKENRKTFFRMQKSMKAQDTGELKKPPKEEQEKPDLEEPTDQNDENSEKTHETTEENKDEDKKE
ncbi:hypothetical protein ACFL6Y_01375 [Elusimicrobiota bacterium]